MGGGSATTTPPRGYYTLVKHARCRKTIFLIIIFSIVNTSERRATSGGSYSMGVDLASDLDVIVRI